MPLTQSTQSNTYIEPAPDGATFPTIALLTYAAPTFDLGITGAHDGALVNWSNNGVYDLVDLRAPLVLTDGGGGLLTLAASGTVYAVLGADGSGVAPTATLSTASVAAFYPTASGVYPLVGINGGGGLQLIAYASAVQPFI